MSKNYTNEISKLQWELNKIIGRDTLYHENRSKWYYDYILALHMETCELMDCINWKWWTTEGKNNQYQVIVDEKNAIIEAIDCLHFLVSLMQICGLLNKEDNQDIFKNGLESIKAADEETSEVKEDKKKLLSTFVANLMFASNNLMQRVNNAYVSHKDDKCISYFFSSKKFPIRYKLEEEDFKLITVLINSLISIFYILDLSIDKILNVYKKKHNKNVLRQENGYSVATKTEDDNNEIKDEL